MAVLVMAMMSKGAVQMSSGALVVNRARPSGAPRNLRLLVTFEQHRMNSILLIAMKVIEANDEENRIPGKTHISGEDKVLLCWYEIV